MKTVGLLISKKENEKRRALIPSDIKNIKHPEFIFIEKGYGNVLGYDDNEYEKYGVLSEDRTTILKKDIICDPKVGDGEYLVNLNEQIIFGWVHAVQNKDITDTIINNKLTAYAWEDMYEDGRHSFWRNNEIAGEAAVFHAYLCNGVFPYNTRAAIIGRGNVAKGAIKTLNYMGAEVIIYDRRTEGLLQKEIGHYDVVVNAVLWDTSRKDHIIYKNDLQRMKNGAMIIDISCDRNGGVETSIPTTIEDPVYYVNGIAHYAVDHTPSLFWKTASSSISEIFVKEIDYLIEDNPNEILNACEISRKGVILDNRIISYQRR